MISKQASILPRRLIRRYHTNDPFEIAAALDITIMERSDFQRQKGAFKVVLHNSFIFINAKMSDEMKRIVCAHELGHAPSSPLPRLAHQSARTDRTFRRYRSLPGYHPELSGGLLLLLLYFPVPKL